MKDIHRSHHTQNHRDEKSVDAENHAAAHIALEVEHVYLKPHQEHKVEQTHLPENLKTGIPLKDIEAPRTDSHACGNQPHDVGNFEPFENQRRKQDNHQHDKKYLHRIGDECMGGSVVHCSRVLLMQSYKIGIVYANKMCRVA